MFTKSVYVVVVLLTLSSHWVHAEAETPVDPKGSDASTADPAKPKPGGLWGWGGSSTEKAPATTAAEGEAAPAATGGWLGFGGGSSKEKAPAQPAAAGEAAPSRWGVLSAISGAGSMALSGAGSMALSGASLIKDKAGQLMSTGDLLAGAAALKEKAGQLMPTDLWASAAALKERTMSMLPGTLKDLPLPLIDAASQTLSWAGAGAYNTAAWAGSGALSVLMAAETQRVAAIANLYSKVGDATNNIWKYTDDLKKIASDNVEAGKNFGIKGTSEAIAYLKDRPQAVKENLKNIIENPTVKGAIATIGEKDIGKLVMNEQFQAIVLAFAPPPLAAAIKLTKGDVGKTYMEHGFSTELLTSIIKSQVPMGAVGQTAVTLAVDAYSKGKPPTAAELQAIAVKAVDPRFAQAATVVAGALNGQTPTAADLQALAATAVDPKVAEAAKVALGIYNGQKLSADDLAKAAQLTGMDPKVAEAAKVTLEAYNGEKPSAENLAKAAQVLTGIDPKVAEAAAAVAAGAMKTGEKGAEEKKTVVKEVADEKEEAAKKEDAAKKE